MFLTFITRWNSSNIGTLNQQRILFENHFNNFICFFCSGVLGLVMRPSSWLDLDTLQLQKYFPPSHAKYFWIHPSTKSKVPCWYLGTWSVVWSIYFTYHSQSYLHVRHNFINLFIVLNIYKCFNNLNSFCTPCILRCFLVKFSSTRWFSLYSYTSTTIINYCH